MDKILEVFAIVNTVVILVVLLLVAEQRERFIRDRPATVTISCPTDTVQIAKIGDVWTCIQEGEAG